MVRHRRLYHKRLTFNIPEQEHILNTYTDTIAEWYADAEKVTKTNLPNKGDVLIYPRYGGDGYSIETNPDEWTPNIVGNHETVRILARAPKPKPAWHDAPAVVAHTDDDDIRRPFIPVLDHDTGETRTGYWADFRRDYVAHALIDPVPLIEAKVTDEMVARALDAADRHEAVVINTAIIREALTAALGLETA